MNKQQLAQTIADRTNLAKKQVEDMLEAMTSVITETLIAEGEVTLAGFGEFSARTRKGRIGVNPQNPAKPLTIPPVRVAKFKAGSRLKKSIKTGSVEEAVEKPVKPVPPTSTTPHMNATTL